MKYFSLQKEAPAVSFKEAVIKGLAPDKGLYFPESITPLNADFYKNLPRLSFPEIAFEAIKQFIGDEIPEKALKQLIEETLCFDFPTFDIEENIAVLELFHGPTMAFKDVGARFMARCLGHFNQKDVTVLVATSGDTGGAVASGFLGVPGVNVVILYPSGKVSDIQEKQLTTLGQNITALEVSGDFDQCQAMVKKAFLDTELTAIKNLTSANSINIARWLPQMFYFFFAYQQLQNTDKQVVFSIPSGNYGNICAGMMAQKLGLPINHFVAGTNANDVVPRYLKTGAYQPTTASTPTISNAMDVAAPSNFVRIEQLHNNSLKTLQDNLSGYSYTDAQTREAMNHLYQKHQYIADPHGAIGYLALKDYLKEHPEKQGVFLETAHPIKFLDVLAPEIQKIMEMPSQIAAVLHKEKKATTIKNYEELKELLLS